MPQCNSTSDHLFPPNIKNTGSQRTYNPSVLNSRKMINEVCYTENLLQRRPIRGPVHQQSDSSWIWSRQSLLEKIRERAGHPIDVFLYSKLCDNVRLRSFVMATVFSYDCKFIAAKRFRAIIAVYVFLNRRNIARQKTKTFDYVNVNTPHAPSIRRTIVRLDGFDQLHSIGVDIL
jgi:hypothetical protein